MSRSGEEPPGARRLGLLRRFLYPASSIFVGVFTLFSLAPATPRAEESSETRRHDLILKLTLAFVGIPLASSTALVVYTAWTHDLRNGVLAIAVAVVLARVAMNWRLWKNERDAEETP